LRFEDRQRRQREALVLIRRERNAAELLPLLATLLADREKLVTRHQACEHSWLARAQ
jgi:hypothetical protein